MLGDSCPYRTGIRSKDAVIVDLTGPESNARTQLSLQDRHQIGIQLPYGAESGHRPLPVRVDRNVFGLFGVDNNAVIIAIYVTYRPRIELIMLRVISVFELRTILFISEGDVNPIRASATR